MIKINNWSVIISPGCDTYTPPECLSTSLHGLVDNHPKLGENVWISSSPITNVNGRVIQTLSGSEYILGRIDPEYRKVLRKIRPNWDWKKPITMKGKP